MAKKNIAKPTVTPARAPRARTRRAAAPDAPSDVAGTTAPEPIAEAFDKALPAIVDTASTIGPEWTAARDTRVAPTMPEASTHDPATSDTPSEPGNSPVPSYDDIARAAYERYLSRGGDHGRDFDDWLEAEHALRSRK
jgi:hypothetical protein